MSTNQPKNVVRCNSENSMLMSKIICFARDCISYFSHLEFPSLLLLVSPIPPPPSRLHSSPTSSKTFSYHPLDFLLIILECENHTRILQVGPKCSVWLSLLSPGSRGHAWASCTPTGRWPPATESSLAHPCLTDQLTSLTWFFPSNPANASDYKFIGKVKKFEGEHGQMPSIIFYFPSLWWIPKICFCTLSMPVSSLWSVDLVLSVACILLGFTGGIHNIRTGRGFREHLTTPTS